MFDAYEIVFYSKALTSAQGDAVAAALVAGYGIPAIAHSYLLEGDSFTQGIGQVTSGENIAMKLTEPGALLVPANWRVLNSGVSGNTVGDVTTRRDKAHSALASEAMLRGNGARNVVAINIGGNNMSPNTTAQGSLIYAAIRDLLHTKGKGYLERGWEVRSFVNAAIGGGRAIVLTQLRACLRHPSYFTDVLAGPRQTYEGKLRLIDLAKIRLSGATLFDTKTDAANNRYYQGDGTHPTVLGNNYLANGGDNRTFSYSGAL